MNLTGRPIYQKAGAVRDESGRKKWAAHHDYCMACGRSAAAAASDINAWPGLQTHHIEKSGRSDEPCNYLRVCGECHNRIESHTVTRRIDGTRVVLPKITYGMTLWLKRRATLAEYDPARLAVLRGRPLPDVEEPPAELLAEYEARRGR